MVFDKLFGRNKKKRIDPGIEFGRYSDNNKSIAKVNRWTEADELFRKGQYPECFEAFFDYLCDERQQNVVLERNEAGGKFYCYQGSKIIRGEFNQESLSAEVKLALMPEPNIPVMRRLLEMNFHLHYSRYALTDSQLCMRFDTDISTANPNKLYYGLKELSIKADKQDDLLVQEFDSLQPFDTEHILPIPDEEKELRFSFLQKWIGSTLDYINTLDADKFSGGIAYLLLALVFRLDYLIAPEGKLMNELEKVLEKYYSKDEKTTIDRNQKMIEALVKIKNKPKEDIFLYMFRSKHTFSIVTPQDQKTISEAINNAIQNMYWYRDNNYPKMANEVIEYGLSYTQFSYSLPQPVSDLFKIFMEINHEDYFLALGFSPSYYDAVINKFEEEDIMDVIEEVIENWKPKYPKLDFNTKKLRFDNLVNFNHSFASEIAELNFEF